MEEQHIKKSSSRNSKEYNLAYYHQVIKSKGPRTCCYCSKDYMSESSLKRHQLKSITCLTHQLQKQLDDIKR
jgi:hypothetical protein